MSHYPWDNTTNNIAAENDSRYETPGGAQQKIDAAFDEFGNEVELPIKNGSIVERHIRLENVTERTIAQKAVTRSKIGTGAVGAQELDPTLLQNYGDIAVQAKFTLVDEKLAETALVYNVKSLYGAIGDGNPHPLSERYTTLSNAQSVYPFVTDLAQQIDWCAFVKMFRDATITRRKCWIPRGTYYLVDPLEEIGNYSITSTENGNFVIEGESEHDTLLLFNLTSNSQVAFPLKNNSSGWDISNFRIKNLTDRKGVGFYFDSVYKSVFKNIQAFKFDIGHKKKTFISTFMNVEGANCACGMYDEGGTSTAIISCYMNYNTALSGDIRDHAGTGFYIASSDYNKYSACASDSNTIAYKIKTTQSSYAGFVSDTLEMDNCGCEGCGSAYYIDAKSAEIKINRPTVYNIADGKLAHVENAYGVTVASFSDPVYGKVTRGSAVGPGVVRFVDCNFNTGGNASLYPSDVPTYDKGLYGLQDFSYDGIRLSASRTYVNGKLIQMSNTIEFEIYLRTNGQSAGAKIDILPILNYTGSGTPIDRGGAVYVGGLNGSGTIYYNLSKTNVAFGVTVTKIGGSGSEVGLRVLIEPFTGLASPTAHQAIITVDAFASPIGTDGNGKNHNIKTTGTYTGRENIKLKGVDY